MIPDALEKGFVKRLILSSGQTVKDSTPFSS